MIGMNIDACKDLRNNRMVSVNQINLGSHLSSLHLYSFLSSSAVHIYIRDTNLNTRQTR
jgi:hypothetical protein